MVWHEVMSHVSIWNEVPFVFSLALLLLVPGSTPESKRFVYHRLRTSRNSESVMKAIDSAFEQWRWRAAGTVDYHFPCSEHMNCIGNCVAQLRGYHQACPLSLRVANDYWHLKCLNCAKTRRISSVYALSKGILLHTTIILFRNFPLYTGAIRKR